MDEEEVVVTEAEPEQVQEPAQEQETSQTPRRQGTTIADRIDDAKDSMQAAGKTVENFGKGEEKLANLIDGGKKTTKAAANVGSAASSTAEGAAKAGAAQAAAREKAAQATAEAGKATKEAGKAGKAASEGVGAASKAGHGAAKALESNQYTAAVGAAVDTASTAGDVASTAGKAASTAAEIGGGTTEAAARAAEAEAKAEKAGFKAAENTAKGAKKGANAAKKATDGSFADKLRQRGKLHQAQGKRIQEAAEKFDSEKIAGKISDRLGTAGKFVKTLFDVWIKSINPTTIAKISLLFITILTILITYILSPMFYMDQIKKTNPDDVEKITNFLTGLGFKDSEQAFYDEVSYLKTHYGNELDFPYIMSALYFTDIYGVTGDEYFNREPKELCAENKTFCDKIIVQFLMARRFLEKAETTEGTNGLKYSSHKLYRLRELAKHQFSGNKEAVTVPLSEYIALCKERMDNETQNILEFIPMLIVYALCAKNPLFGTLINKFYEVKGFTEFLEIFEGTENWNTIMLYQNNGGGTGFGEAKLALKNLLEIFFGCFFNIKGISINMDSVNDLNTTGSEETENSDKCTGANERLSTDGKTCICKKYYARDSHGTCAKKAINDIVLERAMDLINVEYYEEVYDQDAFENYLVEHYVREMPEFSTLVKDADGKINEQKVLQVTYEIRATKEIFDAIYQQNGSAEDYVQCAGNMNLDLLSELTPPIDLEIGQKITFSGTNIYGLYNGKVHKGVDLENSSTGTREGDNVYSIYDGKVIESTVDDTFSNKAAKGGWVVIEYTVQYSDSEAGESKLDEAFKYMVTRIQVTYGGLNPKDLKLKKGNPVKKGEVIGHVGSAADSENGKKASLHFGIYDVTSEKYLNPINMFITCGKSNIDGMCGVNNEQKIWSFLISKGYSKMAAAGIMGVWNHESRLKPYIVQTKSDSYSKEYTKKVDNGTISKNKFVKDGPGGNGYGLAQWTTPERRKEDLYDLAKQKGKSIGSIEVQIEFFEKEMNSNEYKKVKKDINKATSIEETTKIFLRDYEGGCSGGCEKHSLKKRTQYAKEFYEKYKDFSCK